MHDEHAARRIIETLSKKYDSDVLTAHLLEDLQSACFGPALVEGLTRDERHYLSLRTSGSYHVINTIKSVRNRNIGQGPYGTLTGAHALVTQYIKNHPVEGELWAA